ncbi:MAG: GNAT family N-acetyltransferase [Erysipelotrichaceae bacterium]|nr:GNAT family N-acetyltransferase [Erysipelotrichaceae bacterium]
MKLIEPSMEYAQQIMAYRQEFLQAGGSMDGSGSLRRCETAEEWIRREQLYKSPETLPEGKVLASQYMYVREADNKIVGLIQIRHYLNDYLENYGGHIGYSVAPSERRKGYASAMLKKALDICRQMGLERVMISCYEDNEASRRTILKNGGVYESTAIEPDSQRPLQRYWIDLRK